MCIKVKGSKAFGLVLILNINERSWKFPYENGAYVHDRSANLNPTVRFGQINKPDANS